jgi:KH domain
MKTHKADTIVIVLNCDLQFNFVGKLLGPKGNSLKRLQEETMCKMSVLGRGSMRDRKKVSAGKRDGEKVVETEFFIFAGRRAKIERRIQIFAFIRGSSRRDTDIRTARRSSRPHRLCSRRSQTILGSGE